MRKPAGTPEYTNEYMFMPRGELMGRYSWGLSYREVIGMWHVYIPAFIVKLDLISPAHEKDLSHI